MLANYNLRDVQEFPKNQKEDHVNVTPDSSTTANSMSDFHNSSFLCQVMLNTIYIFICMKNTDYWRCIITLCLVLNTSKLNEVLFGIFFSGRKCS